MFVWCLLRDAAPFVSLFFCSSSVGSHTHIYTLESRPSPKAQWEWERERKSAQESSARLLSNSLSRCVCIYPRERREWRVQIRFVCCVPSTLLRSRTHTHSRLSLSLLLNYCQQRFIPCYCQRFQIKATGLVCRRRRNKTKACGEWVREAENEQVWKFVLTRRFPRKKFNLKTN